MEQLRPPRQPGGFRLFSYVTDRVEHDRLLTLVISVLLTLGAVASILTGVAVWPVVFSFDKPGSVLTELFASARTAGWVMLGASAAISIVIMLVRRDGFRMLPALCTNLLIDLVIAFVFTITHIDILDKLNMHDTMGTILWFFASLFFSYSLAIVPALLVAAAVKLIHMILNAILPE